MDLCVWPFCSWGLALAAATQYWLSGMEQEGSRQPELFESWELDSLDEWDGDDFEEDEEEAAAEIRDEATLLAFHRHFNKHMMWLLLLRGRRKLDEKGYDTTQATPRGQRLDGFQNGKLCMPLEESGL
jgi:hypothetical protein